MTDLDIIERALLLGRHDTATPKPSKPLRG